MRLQSVCFMKLVVFSLPNNLSDEFYTTHRHYMGISLKIKNFLINILSLGSTMFFVKILS